jgi:hypothetical protein
LAGKNAAAQKDREQIRRLLSTQPKPAKPAPVVSGGGIVGMAEVRSTAGSVLFASGQAAMSRDAVTYGTVTDPYSGSPGAAATAPSSWCTVDGYQLSLTPGWYNLTISIQIVWAVEGTTPASLSAYIQGGWDVAHNNTSYFPAASLGTPGFPSFGILQVVSHGPTFINDGDLVWAECPGSGYPSADNDPSRSSIIWNITKYG